MAEHQSKTTWSPVLIRTQIPTKQFHHETETKTTNTQQNAKPLAPVTWKKLAKDFDTEANEHNNSRSRFENDTYWKWGYQSAPLLEPQKQSLETERVQVEKQRRIKWGSSSSMKSGSQTLAELT